MKLLILMWIWAGSVSPDSVFFLHTNAEVWAVDQRIEGLYYGSQRQVDIYVNGEKSSVQVSENRFSFPLTLSTDLTQIVAATRDVGKKGGSDTLRLTLGYRPVPMLQPGIKAQGQYLELTALVLENPYQEPLQLAWEPSAENPESVPVEVDSGGSFRIRTPGLDGDYRFFLRNQSRKGITQFELLLRKSQGKIQVFDAAQSAHPWMEEAVVYQLSPYNFSNEGGYTGIFRKLPELREMGINTLYFQPVYQSNRRGQGYDVTGYFQANTDYGSEFELKELIAGAKDLGFRVLFDLVLNHTSIQHPYAIDRVAHGPYSHYADFYQTSRDAAVYSSHYQQDSLGFISYFWKDLVNLNYDQEEVQRWMLEVCKYWLLEYDLDGFRFDAIWGVLARKPEFGPRLRRELKSLRPDILLLAEDKGRKKDLYDLGFDAGYDWTNDTVWVSQWSWEYEYDPRAAKTLFGRPDPAARVSGMTEAIFSDLGQSARLLRFTENNDLPRFPAHHGQEKSRAASALSFALPGIPMLYQGQEIGALAHPYSPRPVFDHLQSISQQDTVGGIDFYTRLIRLRSQHPSLSRGSIRPVEFANQSAVLAFLRESDEERILVILNMDDKPIALVLADASLQLPDNQGAGYRQLLSSKPLVGPLLSEKETIVLDSFEIVWLKVD